MNKRVLHIYKSYFPDSMGGVEQVIKGIASRTQMHGYNNTILTLSDNPRIDTDNDIDVVRFAKQVDVASCPFNFSLLKKFRHYADQADILHYHFPWPFADLLHLTNRIKKPSIVTYHSDIVRQRLLKQCYKPIMKSFLSSVDYIAPTSENYLATSRDLIPFQEKCRVASLGIDLDFYPTPSVATLEKWEKRLGRNFILFIGVLRYYKGLHVLLDAVKNTDIPVVIAGTGKRERNLKKEAIRSKINNVIFTGFINDEDKVALLKLCRAVIVPSHLRSEAFGISLIEGLAFGKPLISTELGTGTSFVNQHNETGLIVPPNDRRNLRKAMQTLLADEKLAETMGKKARERYEKYFTAKQMGDAYLRLYEKL